MATNAKTSINPLHAAFPQIFKRNGEVRRLPNSPRFNRKLAIEVDKKAPTLYAAKSVTIETPVGLFIVSSAMTELMQKETGIFHAMMYNGFIVYPTPVDIMDLLPVSAVQLSFIQEE